MILLITHRFPIIILILLITHRFPIITLILLITHRFPIIILILLITHRFPIITLILLITHRFPTITLILLITLARDIQHDARIEQPTKDEKTMLLLLISCLSIGNAAAYDVKFLAAQRDSVVTIPGAHSIARDIGLCFLRKSILLVYNCGLI